MQIPNGKRIGAAAVQLLAGNLDLSVKSFGQDFDPNRPYGFEIPIPTNLTPSQFRGLDESWYYSADADGHNYFKFKDHNSGLAAYTKCGPLQSVINRKAQAYITGKNWILDAKEKVSDSSEAKRLRKLFLKPNPLQTWKQFEAQGYIYQQIFGWSLVLAIKPYGFDAMGNIYASSLWNIPPTMIDVEETKKLFYQTDQAGIISQIVLNYKGEKTVLKVPDVYFFKDFVPSFYSLILPGSRISGLEYPINNIIGAYKTRGRLIHNRDRDLEAVRPVRVEVLTERLYG